MLESQTDEELLLNIPFRQNVKVFSLEFTAPNDGMHYFILDRAKEVFSRGSMTKWTSSACCQAHRDAFCIYNLFFPLLSCPVVAML